MNVLLLILLTMSRTLFAEMSDICQELHPQYMQELVPKKTFFTEEATAVTLKEWRHNHILLHFWAPWSIDGIAEIQWLDQLETLLAEQEVEDFVILPVALASRNLFESNISLVNKFYEVNHVRGLKKYVDLGNHYYEAIQNDRSFLPLTILVDQKGREVGRYAGALLSKYPCTKQTLNQLRQCHHARAQEAMFFAENNHE